ncbi:MAG TPA: pyrimidine 5'-nucleotidase [Terricaulis sp.]|nr:pyrimidine 5'-nucleotidase [Terricaulis sp.]HRP09619.1 pyrimidine 5'-nucleotidase [Terricaulis sp.]
MSAPRDFVFDLDNTLYPVSEIYEDIGQRMTAYIARALKLPQDEALTLRERYFHQYGATVTGLSKHHGVDAHDFMADVHDVDYSTLTPDPELAALIAQIKGRRIVFTNGGGGHGQRALKQLGLADLFERVFDMEDAGFIPKPDPQAYQRLIAACGLEPERAVLVEDTLKNLEPAHLLGFSTVLVGAVHPDPRPAYVDAHFADVKDYLRDYLARA